MYLSPDQFSFTNNLSLTPPKVSTLLEQGSGEINEDVVLAGTNATYGVFDGATSLVNKRFGSNLTGGRIAAQTCAATFAEKSHSLVSLAGLANSRIHELSRLSGINLGAKEELWSSSAAVVRLDGEDIEWCQLGDCQILAIYHDGGARLLTDDPSQDVQTLVAWQRKAAQQKNSGNIMEVMAEEIVQVRKRVNLDYGVFNGEPEALNFLRSGRISLRDIQDLIIFSDGLMLPKQDPTTPFDVDRFVDLYRKGGLQRIRAYVRKKQGEDISCKIYPRFKTHDDISAVSLHFTSS